MSVCFASEQGFTGCVASCRNAAAVLGAGWTAIHEEEFPAAVLDCELLILSSWSKTYELLLEHRTSPTIPRWHSPLLQTELGGESWKLMRIAELQQEGRVPAVAVSDPTVALALGGEGVVVLPDVLDEQAYAGVRQAVRSGVNVSLFGAAHERKNLLVQSAAFEILRRAQDDADWTLHLAGQTARVPDYGRWLDLMSIPHVDHGFLGRSDYLALVAGMDVGLSVTLSESYCYVAADHLALGVPAVTSSTVACADTGDLEVANPWDAQEVADCLRLALEEPGLVEPARRSLRERARSNAERARRAVAELRERAER